jgi:Dolichyl-phosphate-mannose-protein mannosyltransferase
MTFDRIAKRPGVTLGLFVAASFLARAPFLTVPCLDLDEAAQLVGSWELLRGGTPYVDVVDNRPPLLYAFYALAQALLGRGLPAVRLLVAIAVVPLTAFAASAFFRHDRRGVVAGLLYVVYGAGFLAHDMHSASPEVLMLLPLGAALVAGSSPPAGPRDGLRHLVAGILLGVGALVRQQAALWLPAFALAAWADGERATATPTPGRVGRLLALVGGLALPLAACYTWFAARGAAGELVFWTWTHNLRYAHNPIPPGEAFERAASYLLPFLIATAPLWWAAWRSRPELGRRGGWLAAAVAGSVAGALIGFRFFPHYFIPLYLPLAMAAAPATALAIGQRGWAGRLAVAWPLVLLVAFTAANLLLYRGPRHAYEETRPVFRRVGERLRADPCYGRGRLFVWGFAPQIYVEADLRPASRFVVPQASLTGYVPGNRASRVGTVDTRALVRSDHWDLLMGDLERSGPAFVADTAPSGLHGWDRFPLVDFPRLQAFVRDRYDAVAVVDGVWIWRRKGCAAASPPPVDPSGAAPEPPSG